MSRRKDARPTTHEEVELRFVSLRDFSPQWNVQDAKGRALATVKELL